MLEMTMRVLTTKITNYDKERNRKIHRSAHRFDSIGDTDGTGGYLVHGYVNVLYTERKEKKERAQLRKKGETALLGALMGDGYYWF